MRGTGRRWILWVIGGFVALRVLSALGPFLMLAIGLGAWRWIASRRVVRRWKHALAGLGMDARTRASLATYGLSADAGRFRLRVKRGFRLGIPPWVNRIVVEGSDLPRFDAEAGDDGVVQTGDTWFDKRVRVDGDPAEILAHLDRRARVELDRIVNGRDGVLEGGRIGTDEAGDIRDPENLLARVRDLIQAAEALSLDGRSQADALAANARGEDAPAVRLENLRVLIAAHPDSPQAAEAARGSLDSPDPTIRFEAGRFLGSAGVGALVDLVADCDAPDRLRARALDHLAEAAREEVASRLLPGLATIASGAGGGLALAIARAVSALGDPRGEAAAVVLLGIKDTEIRVAAARALGSAATLLAVEHLLPLTEGFFTPGDVKEAAREAIEQIRDRFGTGEAGRLSIAEIEEHDGALSLVQAGEVSFVEE